MNQQQTAPPIGCAVVLVCVVIGLAYWLGGSVNPLQVYQVGSTTGKVVLSIVGGVATLTAISICGVNLFMHLDQQQRSRKGEQRGQLGCMTVLAIAIIAATYFTTGWWNPVAVYRSGNVWGILGVSIPALALVVFAFAVANNAIWNAIVGRDTRCAAPDCNALLMLTVSERGHPWRCPICKKWWHAKCLYRHGGSAIAACPNHNEEHDSTGLGE